MNTSKYKRLLCPYLLNFNRSGTKTPVIGSCRNLSVSEEFVISLTTSDVIFPGKNPLYHPEAHFTFKDDLYFVYFLEDDSESSSKRIKPQRRSTKRRWIRRK